MTRYHYLAAASLFGKRWQRHAIIFGFSLPNLNIRLSKSFRNRGGSRNILYSLNWLIRWVYWHQKCQVRFLTELEFNGDKKYLHPISIPWQKLVITWPNFWFVHWYPNQPGTSWIRWSLFQTWRPTLWKNPSLRTRNQWIFEHSIQDYEDFIGFRHW